MSRLYPSIQNQPIVFDSIQARYIRPRKRVYQTENFYATIDQNIRNRREVKKILHGKA